MNQLRFILFYSFIHCTCIVYCVYFMCFIYIIPGTGSCLDSCALFVSQTCIHIMYLYGLFHIILLVFHLSIYFLFDQLLDIHIISPRRANIHISHKGCCLMVTAAMKLGAVVVHPPSCSRPAQESRQTKLTAVAVHPPSFSRPAQESRQTKRGHRMTTLEGFSSD